MTLPRLFILVAIVLFSLIFMGAWVKDSGNSSGNFWSESEPEVEEIDLKKAAPIQIPVKAPEKNVPQKPPRVEMAARSPAPTKRLSLEEPPEVDIVEELFKKNSLLPFVETITYKSRVSWQKGRPAWLSDYAAHFDTSRHFIARSLNGKPDYFKQDLVEGDTFNIYRPGVDLSFYLLVDAGRKKLWLYALDNTHKQKTLIKSYPVCLGRISSAKPSGSLTPLGVYSLGNRVAIYKPKVMGFYQGKKTEMIRVFGTRWIPFEKEISGTTAPAKGLGIHGLPWIENRNGESRSSENRNHELVEDDRSIGKNESDGCIRVRASDMEEIYAIVVARPATIEITNNYFDSELLRTH